MSLVATNAGTPERTTIAWPAVASLALGVFGFVTSEFLPPSLLTPMSRDLGTSVGMAGQTVTATAIVAALAGPAVVLGAGRLDRRAILLALTVCLIGSSLLAALGSHLNALIVSRFLLGIGLGGFWALSVALAVRLSPPGKAASAMAVIMMGVSVATVTAAPLGAWISATLGWRIAFYLTATVGVVALIAQLATVPSLPPAGSTTVSTLISAVRRRSIKLALMATFCIAGGHFAAFTYVRPFLEHVSKIDAASLAPLLLSFGVAGFIGNILGGATSRRSARVALAASAVGIAVALAMFVVAGSSYSSTWTAMILWGLAFGAYPVSIQTFLTQAAPDEAESAGAAQLSVFMIAVSIGAVLGGLLVDRFGPVLTFAIAGASALLGAPLIFATKPLGRD